MSDKIKLNLKKMIADNWEAVVDLGLDAGQEDLVASTSIRLPRLSSILTHARVPSMPERVVDFLMYDLQKTKDKAQEASIYLLMIDRKHQGKGYGRAALSKALEEIRAIPGMNRISIRYIPENPVAKPFYASFGSVEVQRDRDGEMIGVLKL